MENRNTLIDYVRGVAVILMIFGHNIQFGSGKLFFENRLFWYNKLFQFIYSFHMPLFALISGYLLYYSLKKNTSEFVVKKIKCLVVPLISWSFLYSVVKSALEKNLLFENFISQIQGGWWFINTTLVSILMLYFIEKYSKYPFIFYLIIFLFMFMLPQSLCLYVFVFPFYVIGLYFNKYKEKVKFLYRNNMIILIVTLFLVLFSYYNENVFIYNSGTNIFSQYSILKQLEINLYRILIGLVGSLLVYMTCNIALKWKSKVNNLISQLLIRIGKYSMQIYFINITLNRLLIQRIFPGLKPCIIVWISLLNVELLIYYIIIKVLKKFKLSRQYLLGIYN